ncbi:MAG: hypothetical protein OXQ90_05655 [Gammaproteobacteria bacterium]|nr:hypothetical protein [Gammaproteobacteria bacterium]
MSLRERMRGTDSEARARELYRKYGVVDNPFPAAGQPSGHPRLEDAVDDEIEGRVRRFEADRRTSQVVLIEGTQGVGKTNLLNYYEEQFRDYYKEDEAFYIIRYYPDPEPTFDSVLRKVFQSLDQGHFERIGRALATRDDGFRNEVKEIARSHEVRIVLNSLESAGDDAEEMQVRARLALDWFVGLRLLKQHRETLGVSFRLDTVESRTQALRDIVYISEKLDLLKGVLLLLDELEKQDYSLSKTPVLRFISAIRALIDALPRCVFLMLAITPQARLRYFAMLPALAGRLQDRITLTPIGDFGEAMKLFGFYVEHGRRLARVEPRMADVSPGAAEALSEGELESMFGELWDESEARGIEGVTQRDFLHSVHAAWEARVGG